MSAFTQLIVGAYCIRPNTLTPFVILNEVKNDNSGVDDNVDASGRMRRYTF